MDLARADAIAARRHLATTGWIPRRAESFRHLPPPDAPVWLGDAALEDPCGSGSASSGWTLEAPGEAVQARLLDASDHGQRTELLKGLPTPGEDTEAAPFAWAHRALLRDGLRVRVRASTNEVLLRVDRRLISAAEAPLLVIELDAGARCTLLESHEAHSGVQNLQVHVRLARGAQLRHARIIAPRRDAYLAHHVHVQLEDAARYEQCMLATGSRYHLQRMIVDLQGRSASADVASVLLAFETALEQQVRSRHDAAGTQSALEMLALGSGSARAVGNAHGFIASGADSAQVRQRLAGIPTGGQPKLVLRPHLEIHHDNVQAAHGATWGALPEDALFLARQRGLDEASAKALIVEGLARAVLARGLDDVYGPTMDAALADAVTAHLAPQAAKELRHG